MRANATRGDHIAVFPTMIGGDGKTVAGGEPMFDYALLAVRTDFGGDLRIARLPKAEYGERTVAAMPVFAG